MAKPTIQEAQFFLEVYKMWNDATVQAAKNWILANFNPTSWEDFNTRVAPAGSAERQMVDNVFGQFELIGTFVKVGVLNEDILFNAMGSFVPIWQRAQPIIAGWREERGADMWENYEYLIEAQKRWVAAKA